MKLSFLVAIVYCLHVVFCVPTSSITKASSGEINLLTTMKKLLDQGSVSVKNQKKTITLEDIYENLRGLMDIVLKDLEKAQNDSKKFEIENADLKKDLEKCQQCSGSLEEIKKDVKQLLSLNTQKSVTGQNQPHSGYALANPPHDQYLLPDGNKQIVIELLENGNHGAHGAYVQRP